MRVSTAWNHAKRLLSIQAGIYWYARHGGAPHADILADVRERIYGDAAWSKVPGWVRDRVMSRGSLRLDALYRPDVTASELGRMLADARAGRDVKPVAYLRTCHVLDGREVTTDEICAAREAGDEEAWQRVVSATIWNHKPTQAFGEWRTWKGEECAAPEFTPSTGADR